MLAEARRSIDRPTIFNNLGPLCNPASAQHQVIGVWDSKLLDQTANVISKLGTKRSWVVHGENGLDEISLAGKTQVAEIHGENVTHFEITAADFDVYSLGKDLPSNCAPRQSAEMIRDVLGNKMKDRDAERLVLINAAAAIYIAGNAATLPEAYEQAEKSIRDGAAVEKLNKLAAETAK